MLSSHTFLEVDLKNSSDIGLRCQGTVATTTLIIFNKEQKAIVINPYTTVNMP